MKHRWVKSSNGDWACDRCHRWMDSCRPKVCDPAKERARLREKIKRARRSK